jgi:hypothetical protein
VPTSTQLSAASLPPANFAEYGAPLPQPHPSQHRQTQASSDARGEDHTLTVETHFIVCNLFMREMPDQMAGNPAAEFPAEFVRK